MNISLSPQNLTKNSSPSEIIIRVAQLTADKVLLMKAENAKKVLPGNAQFASVSSVAMVNDPDAFYRSKGNDVKVMHAVGTAFVGNGYLFHDGVTLKLADTDQILFSIPLDSLDVEIPDRRSLEMIILNLKDGRKLAMGDSWPIDLEPFKSSYNKNYGLKEGPWKFEFARIGKLDAENLKREDKKNKTMLIIVLSIFGLLFLLSLVF